MNKQKKQNNENENINIEDKQLIKKIDEYNINQLLKIIF